MKELTVKEAAEILDVTPHRVRQFIRSGELPAREQGVYLIKRSDLRLVKNRAKPGRPKKEKANGK